MRLPQRPASLSPTTVARRLAAALTAAGLLACLLGGRPAAAQTPPPTPPTLPDSVRQMIEELQQVREQLADIQDRTIEESPELRARRTAAEQAVLDAMNRDHPELQAKIDRLETIGDDLHDAHARQDTVRVRALILEGQRLSRDVESARAEALEAPEIAQQVQGYRNELLAAMKARDPGTDELIQRMEGLIQRIRAAMPGG